MKIISRGDSEVIKGILILLIVLGHLCAPGHLLNNSCGRIFVWVYQFHVTLFFILPFFYDNKPKCSWHTVWKIVMRCWWPYLMFFMPLALLYQFCIVRSGVPPLTILYDFVLGYSDSVKHATGFAFLWFLPAYAVCMVLKLLWDNVQCNSLRVVIGVVTVLTFFNLRFYFGLMPYIPLGIMTGFYYFFYGILTRALFRIFDNKFLTLLLLSVCVFGLCSLVLLSGVHIISVKVDNLIIRSLMAPAAFVVLWHIVEALPRREMLAVTGKLSLRIYLLNMLVLNALEMLIPRCSIVGGAMIFFLTFACSIGLAYLWQRIPVLRMI